MGIRKAYVDWSRLDGSSVLENRKVYMVFPADGTASCPVFATWYEAGTVVDVGLSEDADVGGCQTAEEKLMACIFGRSRTFAIPEDGFYVMTADYGVDDGEDGAFRYCKEQPVCFGNRYGWDGGKSAMPAYWAEVPVLPAGVLREPKAAVPPSAAEQTAKRLDAAEALLAGDRIAEQAYNAMSHGRRPGDSPIDMPMAGAIYSIPPTWLAEMVCGVHGFYVGLARIPEERVRDFWSALGKAKDRQDGASIVASFCGEHDLDRKWSWLLFHYVRFLNEDFPDFYANRDSILSAGGLRSLNLPAVLQEALALSKIPFRVGRCVKLEAMGAPEVILVHELRMLAEYVAMARQSHRIACVRPEFAGWFGVKPDGTRGDSHCEYGDMELRRLRAPNPEDSEDDGDDEEEESDDGVAGVDYPYFAGVPAPNFLMRKCRFVIWDNVKCEYVRDADGNVEQFSDGRIRERLAELDAAARVSDGK